MGSRRGHGGSRELLLRHKSPICSETEGSGFFELLKIHQGLKSIFRHYELCSGSFTQLQKLVS